MERYRTLYWVFIYAPIVLGLLALFLMALPGELDTKRMLIGLGVYLVVGVGGGILASRRLDR